MRFVTFRMHCDAGDVVQLRDLLAIVPENTWIWSVLDFYGVGVPPSGMTMAEFEVAVRSTPSGYRFSWSDLKSFSEHLEQTYDCLIVAATTEQEIVPAEIAADKFDRCQIVLQALDSTEWSIGSNAKALLEAAAKQFC